MTREYRLPATLALVLALPALCPAATYSITDLGTLLAGYNSLGFGINDSGQVVGRSRASTTFAIEHGVLFDHGTRTDLGTLGGDSSQALDINHNGQIVGNAALASGVSKPTLWQNGVPQDLAPSAFIGLANGINDAGQVVGYTEPSGVQAFVWSQANGLHYIGTLGGSYSNAMDINATGQIVGVASTVGDGTYHAFMYDGTMHDLGALDGNSSVAHAVNGNGLIVGESGNYAFLYDGTMHDLGMLHGGSAVAFDINNSGQIVGDSEDVNGQNAFLYSGGAMHDLNSLIDPLSGWMLKRANGINDSGQITGYGWIGGDSEHPHAFLLTPTPEPSSLVLAVLAFVGLAAWAWRRSRLTPVGQGSPQPFQAVS